MRNFRKPFLDFGQEIRITVIMGINLPAEPFFKSLGVEFCVVEEVGPGYFKPLFWYPFFDELLELS